MFQFVSCLLLKLFFPNLSSSQLFQSLVKCVSFTTLKQIPWLRRWSGLTDLWSLQILLLRVPFIIQHFKRVQGSFGKRIVRKGRGLNWGNYGHIFLLSLILLNKIGLLLFYLALNLKDSEIPFQQRSGRVVTKKWIPVISH